MEQPLYPLLGTFKRSQEPQKAENSSDKRVEEKATL